MTLCLTRTLRIAATGLITILLAACGGGATTDPAPAIAAATASQAAEAKGTKQIQSTPLNADGPATQLVVRAHANLAGNVGAILAVRVDGVVVGSVEVRSTTPTDHRITVPALQPGHQIDLAYVNDGSVAGVDRNLYITQITAADTYVLPTTPGVLLDRGTGAAAFDGVDVLPGQVPLYGNGALRFTWPAPNMTGRLTVRASGTLAGNVGPQMVLRVDGVIAGSTEVRSSVPADHTFAVPPVTPGSRIDVIFTNDEVVDGADRQLRVAYLMAGDTVLLPTAVGVVYDQGSGTAALDGVNVMAGQPDLPVNGALRGRWPTTNMTDTLTVRASGSLAGGVAPAMQVLVDGVLLGSANVTSTSPADFSFPTLPMQPGSQVQVMLANPGTAGTETRSLNLAYAINATTVLRPSDPGVQATATSFTGAWPAPNLTDHITIRAKGALADNVGPIMQVRVDGVVTATVEVRNTDFADITVPAFPMQPGRKVEVVYTNDGQAGGIDRNLFIDYVISGATFMRPTAAGSVIDRGTGQAAFDNLDVIPGHGHLYWSAAWRATWPQPNITSTLTVRASSTLAGNVGPIMRIWVDGVAVSSTEVRASTPTDHTLAVPSLQPGSRIAVTFDNPGAVDGVQRALNLTYLLAGTTVLKPTASGAVYNAGNLQATWPTVNLTDTLTVRAHGVLAGDVGPILQVLVDGVLVGSTEVRATEPQDYRFAVPVMRPGAKVDIAYINDDQVNGVDRNLFVHQVLAGATAVLANAAGNVVDWGAGAGAFDGVNVVPGQVPMWANGALRLTWPEPNLTEQVIVRASGTLLDGIGPVMTLRVDGIVVGTAEVTSTSPADLIFSVPALVAGSRIDVAHTNHASAAGTSRNLNVHYLRAGNAVWLPNAAGNAIDLGSGLAAFDSANVQPPQATLNANSALRGRWPALNMTEMLMVRAGGSPAGSVAPVMQVLVDGVLLGSANVTSTSPADFNFPTLPMQPGSQVQVMLANPGTAGTETRSLNLAYAINATTVLRPSDPGVQATAISFTGAWPAPNLTDHITIRAKGALAGNVGPIMQVRVDGVVTATVEVRNTDFADITVPAFPMQAGRKVEVVYTNDGQAGGIDRNLFIDYVISGATFMRPTAAGSVIDRGTGQAAFDNLDVIPGHGHLYWSAAWRATWPQPNITSTLTVRAGGTLAGNVGPVMAVRVDGVLVSSVEVRSPTLADYNMPVPALKPGSQVDLAFMNDAVVDGADRNLQVGYALAGSTFVLPTSAQVRYDLGQGNAAFDGLNMLPGQSTVGLGGALRFAWPSANLTDTIAVRASATVAAGVGALMQLRIDGVIVGTHEVRSATPVDFVFSAPRLQAGSRIDLAFINDLKTPAGEDRNLFVQYLKVQGRTLIPSANGVVLDNGSGEAAVDGTGTEAGSNALYGNGALRWVMPAPTAPSSNLAAQYDAARLLMQAGFGANLAEINRVAGMPRNAWLDEQFARPPTPDFVNAIQARFDRGDAWRPFGASYTPAWVAQRFWQGAANAPDALRKRMTFALHQMLMVSQADSSLYDHARAYASYLDILNAHAFGNFRSLLEEIALSPAMGIYLSHMRNRPEDLVVGRMPDENFAREIMQLFTIGLHELNIDGTPRLDALGNPIETYTNDDVMAMAKVFTGYGWAFPDTQLTENRLRWGGPDYSAAGDTRIDLQRMKPYPGMHSAAEKRLFMGKSQALLIPAGTPAADSLRLALDTLFNHANVGPFVSRQLIQRLVTSHPSPAYVARVATVFNNNGHGVRGDLGAVLRAILMDGEAVSPPAASIGKLREPVLRVANWLRAFDATSVSGDWLLVSSLDGLGQKALHAPSVFGYFRPGYMPPNTRFATSGTTVPEMQIVNEATTAQWVNTAMGMASDGIGWTGTANDVRASIQVLADMAAQGDVDGLIERLNLLLYAGRMSANLKNELLQSISSVAGNTPDSQLNRARVALFLALAASEYMVQP